MTEKKEAKEEYVCVTDGAIFDGKQHNAGDKVKLDPAEAALLRSRGVGLNDAEKEDPKHKQAARESR